LGEGASLMRARLSVLACLAFLTAAVPGSSLAAELKPAELKLAELTLQDAQGLEAALRAWLGGVLGPEVKLPERPVQLTPEGDHYRVLLPIPGLDAAGGDAGQTGIAAIARPQDAGRWLLEQIRIPSPAKLTLARPGEAAALGPLQILISAGAQDSRASFGPDLAVPSRLDMGLTDFAVGVDGPNQRQVQHFDRYNLQMTVRAGAPGRLNATEEVTADGYSSEQRHPGLPPIAAQAERLRLAATLDELSQERAGPLLASSVRFLGSLLVGLSGPGGFSGMHMDREAIRALLLALNDVAAGGRVEESAEDLQIKAAGLSGGVRRAGLEIGARSPDGLLNAWLGVSIEGLSVQGLPGKAGEWLPRRLILRPTVSGLSVADLTRIAMAATDPQADPQALDAALAALLAHGGVTAGLDTLLLDLGPAQLEGKGTLLLRGPDDLRGAARITATGMDALLAEVGNDPHLAPLVGGLALAMNLAKREGAQLVWNLAFADGRLTVNGIDPTQAPAAPQPRRQPGSNQPGSNQPGSKR
jgi:hypothetical protein